MKLRLLLVFACLLLSTAEARLGDTLGKIKERFGKPADFPQKNAAVWYFEVEDGQVAYTVVFNAKGQSISEGLKPLQRALFTAATAESFIRMQMEPFQASKTARVVKPGENYRFAGKAFTCAARQYVVVDEASGFLIVWTQSGVPSVMAIRPEMMQ